MDILLLDDCQKIESALVENSVGTDSLLVPDDYWNRLNSQERKDSSEQTSHFIEKVF
ncbi:hypothetical protein LEP1GSC127_5152 [Leptospira kirschneri str. 200801925]|nr:hypothetical protein LEP1GSC127_5152 [Leptospira kirschneri str. 200801925]